MKLELKHLAPYLPYGINVIYNPLQAGRKYSKDRLSGIVEDVAFIGLGGRFGYVRRNLHEIKPVLRPLSDLTKDEYTFISEDETDYEFIADIVNMDSDSFQCTKLSYEFWAELFHYHFDVFGLIKEGLAIDINTL